MQKDNQATTKSPDHWGKTFEFTPTKKPRKWRSGDGMFAYADDGRLFISSRMIGMNAMTAMLCCGHDRTPMMQIRNTVLVPFEWAAQEKPDLREQLDAFKLKAEVFATEGRV